MASLKVERAATGTPVTLGEAKSFLRVSTTDDDTLIQIMIDAATESAESFTGRSFCSKGYKQGLDSFPYFVDTALSQLAYPPAYYALPLYSTTMWNYSQMIKLFRPPCISVDRITYLAADDQQWHDLIPFPALWYPGTVVVVGDKRMDNNANVQICTTAGTTASNPPEWNTTIGGFTTENNPDPGSEGSGPVVWENQGPFSDEAEVSPGGVAGGDQFGAYLTDIDSEPARVFPGPPGAMWPTGLSVPNSVQIHFTAGYSADGSNVPSRAKMAILQSVAHWYENREPVVPGSVSELPLHCQMLLWSIRVMDLAPTRG